MKLHTGYPIAVHSHDTKFPRGARLDNTHCPNFVAKCWEVFGRDFDKPLSNPTLLDLGCAGGGLVQDFLEAGLSAFGIDGSDYPKNILGREPWLKYPEHFGTCDITKPFRINSHGGMRCVFTVISAWEVLEHIAEDDLPQLFENIREHLFPGGIFCASICTVPDDDPGIGAVWHVTVRDRDWWIAKLAEFGFKSVDMGFKVTDFPRGSGNPLATGDWAGPNFGFHFVGKRS